MDPTKFQLYGFLGLAAAVIYYLRKPLATASKAVSALTDTLAASPVFQPGGVEYVSDWVAGVPADIDYWLNPPALESVPKGTPVEDDAWLYALWQDSGEYHPTYNPTGKKK